MLSGPKGTQRQTDMPFHGTCKSVKVAEGESKKVKGRMGQGFQGEQTSLKGHTCQPHLGPDRTSSVEFPEMEPYFAVSEHY